MCINCLSIVGVVDVMQARGIYNTRWGLRSSSLLRFIAIQTIDIFIRGFYLQYPDFLSQDIRFWLGLKSAIKLAHHTAIVQAKLRSLDASITYQHNNFHLRFFTSSNGLTSGFNFTCTFHILCHFYFVFHSIPTSVFFCFLIHFDYGA